jgi:hypothetical protein
MARSRPAYAVIMGDIVGSEHAASVKAMHNAFNRAVTSANKRHGADIASPLIITLGDEFQGLVLSLSKAWDVAASMRLRLLQDGVSCRFVIGVAKPQTPINPKRAWNMMGPGLADARERLNDKQATNAYRFSLPDDALSADLLDAIGDALTEVESDWTPTQLSYYAASRSERTNAKVAASLGIAERTFYKVMRAGRAEFHARQAGAIERALTALDQRYGLT